MEGKNIPNSEVQQMTVLEKINKVLAELGSTSKWKRAPEFFEGYEPLMNKTVVMVDDSATILEHFAPHLIVATGGNASFVEYTTQGLGNLIEQIMAHNPDIVVVDYHLSQNLKGTSVIRALMGRDFAGVIVGFSSENSTSKEFVDAGAKGAVDKKVHSPEESVKELANLISKD